VVLLDTGRSIPITRRIGLRPGTPMMPSASRSSWSTAATCARRSAPPPRSSAWSGQVAARWSAGSARYGAPRSDDGVCISVLLSPRSGDSPRLIGRCRTCSPWAATGSRVRIAPVPHTRRVFPCLEFG
jgi:hypothetical protein